MTVLNTIELTKESWVPVAVAIGCWMSLFISIPLSHRIKNTFVSCIFFIYSLFAVAVGIVFLLAYDEFRIPSGEYQYEIIVDDTVSFTDMTEKYNIIEQRGEIFVVEEKE